MERPTQRDTPPSSLAKGLALLETFTAQDTELSIREIARRGGIPRSTAYRLVTDLVQWGALERGRSGLHLGTRLFEIGHLVPLHRRLRELAIPFAHNLNEITRLTCNIAVRDGKEIVYVDKISSRTLLVPHSRTGGRASLHATALGKAILAFSPPNIVTEVLGERLVARTAKTITDPAALLKELATIRNNRVAYDVEESRLGLFCVAAPFFTYGAVVAGAISVTGATALSEAQHFAPAVRATAMALTSALARHPASQD